MSDWGMHVRCALRTKQRGNQQNWVDRSDGTTQILEDGPYADTELNCQTYLAVINKDGRFRRQQTQWLTLKPQAYGPSSRPSRR